MSASVKNNASVSSYQWLLNNENIAGATSSKLTRNNYSSNDEVSCRISGQCGDQPVTASVVITVSGDNVTQIKTVGSSEIRVLPNPNKGDFMLKGTLGTPSDQEVTIEITDVLGQTIYSGKLTAKNGELNNRIQLSSSIANGMYLLNLHYGAESKVFHIVIEQ